MRQFLSRVSTFASNRKKALEPTARLASAAGAQQALGLVTLPVLAAFYDPVAFAHYGLVVGFVAFASTTAGLRYETATVSAASDEDAIRLVELSFWCSVVSGVVGLAILFALKMGRVLGYGALDSVLVLMCLPLLWLSSWQSIFRFYLLRHQRFKAVARMVTLQALSRCILACALGFSRSPLALVAADAVGRASGLRIGVRSLITGRALVGLRLARLGDLTRVARRYRRYALFGLPSSVLDALAIMLPLPILTTLYGADLAGQFALAQRMVAAPCMLICGNAADVFHARIACLVGSGALTVRRELRATALVLFVISSASGSLVVGALSLAAQWTLGPDWEKSTELGLALLPWTVAQGAVSPLSRLVFVLDGMRMKLVYDLIVLLGTIFTPWFAQLGGMAITGAVLSLSIFHVGTYLIYYLVLESIVHRQITRKSECAPF